MSKIELSQEEINGLLEDLPNSKEEVRYVKLSKLIKLLENALDEYGDYEINVDYLKDLNLSFEESGDE